MLVNYIKTIFCGGGRGRFLDFLSYNHSLPKRSEVVSELPLHLCARLTSAREPPLPDLQTLDSSPLWSNFELKISVSPYNACFKRPPRVAQSLYYSDHHLTDNHIITFHNLSDENVVVVDCSELRKIYGGVLWSYSLPCGNSKESLTPRGRGFRRDGLPGAR